MARTVYLFSSGRLSRKDNTLCVELEEKKRYFPVENIRDLIVFGEVDLNKKCLEFMREKEILLHFFDYYGHYVGTFYPREHYNSGYMILRQAEHYSDSRKRLELARKFIEGAFANIRQVLRYYNNRRKNLGEVLAKIDQLRQRLPQCQTIEELMALEGNAREYYYKSFDLILENEDFSFERRTKRPPENYLNALISFGNSLIYTKILTEIYKTHLDPRIGFLHSTNFRRFSLNLDVAEIFKPIIADRILFTVVGKKMIARNDFESHSGMILMKERARRTYVEELEKKLQTTIMHRGLKRKVSYQSFLRMELYKIEKHLMGEKTYDPFIVDW